MSEWFDIDKKSPPEGVPLLVCFMIESHDGPPGRHIAIGYYKTRNGILICHTDDHIINLWVSRSGVWSVDGHFWMPLPEVTQEIKTWNTDTWGSSILDNRYSEDDKNQLTLENEFDDDFDD